MKQTILSLLLILCSGTIFGSDYSKIDKQAATVPGNLKTAGEIAHYLTRNLTLPSEKARAIYYWIAHAIRYDITKMNINNTYTNFQELVDDVLKNRKGVCANYAALFQACCQSVGVQSYVIDGYTRQNNKVLFIGHSWNAVKIDNRFYNIDATWAAGFLNGKKYTQQFRDDFFMVPAAEFSRTHMPFDPVWQFLSNPITPKEFDKGDFSGLNKDSGFNYSDSINVLTRLSKLDKLIRENRRIIASGLTNTFIRNQAAYNQQGIVSEKYNLAVDSFNKGVKKFNYYLECKNKQFIHLSMPDDKILELLSSTRELVESAERSLHILKTDNYELSRSMVSLQRSINLIKQNLGQEDKFAARYVKAAKPLRIFLFYKKKS
ncbi:MAG: transglutaminase domain-containing protein [Bacteroidota bacterium]|nr:transglutaminase domain-containing protein [Bacteroidota bacterium]